MDKHLNGNRGLLFEETVLRTDDADALAVSASEVNFLERLPASFIERLRWGVLGEVLVSAISPEQYVGRAHAADAAMVAVVRVLAG